MERMRIVGAMLAMMVVSSAPATADVKFDDDDKYDDIEDKIDYIEDCYHKVYDIDDKYYDYWWYVHDDKYFDIYDG